MLGDFYGDGNRYRGVTSCDPEIESYTVIGWNMEQIDYRIAVLAAENITLKEQLKQKDAYIEMQQADIAELSNEVQRLREMIME